MDLEIVTVGTELLLGLTVDTNAADIARALAPVGARIVRKTTVADDETRVGTAVGDALARTGFVVVTGGLGPTRDDVTKKAVAALFDAPLELDAAYLATLERRFAELGRGPLPPSNRSQAEVPRGATVLPNRRGTAPGLWLEGTPGVAVLLPGVPHEMRALVREEVALRVQRRLRERGLAPTAVVSRTLRTTGIAESALASLLDGLDGDLAGVTLAYLPGFEGVDLRLTTWDVLPADAARMLDVAVARLRPVLGASCYGEDDTDLAAVVLDRLRQHTATLAVAESCTGGLLGGRLTAIPGSSDVFQGGVVCYSDASKTRDLGVPTAVLEQHGAVSEPVALGLARGVAERFETAAAIGVTGIAGPGGGTPAKPVGTVWLAVCFRGRERVVCRRFPGGRAEIRERSAQAALDLLRHVLEDA